MTCIQINDLALAQFGNSIPEFQFEHSVDGRLYPAYIIGCDDLEEKVTKGSSGRPWYSYSVTLLLFAPSEPKNIVDLYGYGQLRDTCDKIPEEIWGIADRVDVEQVWLDGNPLMKVH